MTYHKIPLIENSSQFFSLISQYRGTWPFCDAAQNRLVCAQTLPGFSDFSLRTFFLI